MAVDQLKVPISYFKRYREHGFTFAMNPSKKIASENGNRTYISWEMYNS